MGRRVARAKVGASVDDLRSNLAEIDKKCSAESLYYFNKRILGYSLLQRKPHDDVARFIQDGLTPGSCSLDMEPRGSFKTTQISQGLPIWLLTQNPNLRILLDSSVLQNSIDNLRVIKNHLEGNSKLRYLYGDMVGGYWVTEEITVKNRTRIDLKEPSIRCASVERVQNGPHYDIIIADDLVDKLNSRTLDGRRAVIEHFKLLFSLLEPGAGILLVVGTYWHYDDLYGFITGELPQFRKRIVDAEVGGVNGGLYFPERLSWDVLNGIKSIQGNAIYNCQYKNNPTPEDADAPFQRTWFKPYSYQSLPQNHNTFISIDPGGEKKKSDEWVTFVAHVDSDNNKYFERIVSGHTKMRDYWDMLFALVEKWKPILVGLETTGGQKWVLEGMMDEMSRRKIYFGVKELPHSGDSKEYRIRRLQPMYQCGAIFHSPDMGRLEDQLLRYPKGADDIADAASMILEICFPPRSDKPKKQAPRSTDEYFLRTHREQLTKKKTHSILGDQW